MRRIYFRDYKKIIIIKNGEKVLKKMTNKGEAIRFQMERGLSNAQISKTLGIPESTIRYYRKRRKNLEVKRNSKLPTKYINKICELTSN